MGWEWVDFDLYLKNILPDYLNNTKLIICRYKIVRCVGFVGIICLIYLTNLEWKKLE